MPGRNYTYGYNLLETNDGMVFFVVPKLLGIISSIPFEDFRAMSKDAVQAHAKKLIITALQERISLRANIPSGDDRDVMPAFGFVSLQLLEAMKLTFYEIFKQKGGNVVDMARRLDVTETVVRRLLDLRHESRTWDIDKVAAKLGYQFVVDVSVRSKFIPDFSGTLTTPKH
jgi:hypothetical protein